jgi:hypothetical protein
MPSSEKKIRLLSSYADARMSGAKNAVQLGEPGA